MSDFQTVITAEEAIPDPSKHVNYVQGMVLGVQDFKQEFAFTNGRVQWLAREAIGYGVLHGLHVRVASSDAGPQIHVSQGVALTPRGELVCVPEDQCAKINAWLAANQQQLSLASEQTLYVKLCYSTCATDNLPIPGEPCRDESELMAPSRIADDFQLALTTQAPDQQEEDMVRAFAAWLRNVRLTNDPNSATSEEDFAQEVRLAWAAGGELSAMPPETLYIPSDRQGDYLRLALRIWVNEVRSYALAGGSICANPPNEGYLLLAVLHVRLTPDRLQSVDLPDIIDESAPFLLHVRMLQEWLIAGRHDVLPSDLVESETGYGIAPNAGIAEEYARADHTHGTPPLPELLGDVESLPAPPDSQPSFPEATDHHLFTTVVAIQGTPVAPEAPIDIGQALVFDGSAWHPGPVPTVLEPANSIMIERRYGLSEAVGVSADYARADHTHGTPPPPELTGEVVSTQLASDANVFRLDTRVAQIYGQNVGTPNESPITAGLVLKLVATEGGLEWQPQPDLSGGDGVQPGAAALAERRYGLSEAVGVSADYARADHTHGTPPAPTLVGDVQVTSTAADDTIYQLETRVATILGQPVGPLPDSRPAPGDVLTLVGRAESPEKLEWQIGSGGTSSSLVVAAGQFETDGTTVFSFNELQATRLDPVFPTVYLMSFKTFQPTENYVVTGTPWTILDSGPSVFEYLGDTRDDRIISFIKDAAEKSDRVQKVIETYGLETAGIMVRAMQINTEPLFRGFMIEISRYPRQDR